MEGGQSDNDMIFIYKNNTMLSNRNYYSIRRKA